MRLRHKAPSTFSLWMVDVLCCSLGSVIFLWLVTDQKLLDTSAEEVSLSERLSQSQKEAELQRKLASMRGEDLERLNKLLAEVTRDRDARKESTRKLDEQQRKRIDELLAQVARLELNKESAEKLLAA